VLRVKFKIEKCCRIFIWIVITNKFFRVKYVIKFYSTTVITSAHESLSGDFVNILQ